MTESHELITRVHARQVLDSRGRPTVEADVILENGIRGRAIVPSGASTGSSEAVELRDHDPHRYQGLGVLRAVDHVNTVIGPALVGRPAGDQAQLDRLMIDLDGTENKSRLGANAILSVSMAVAHAVAASRRWPLYQYCHELMGRGTGRLLPLPMINVLSGGLHARRAVDFQDYLVIPVGASSYSEAIAMTSDVIHAVRAILEKRGDPMGLADEGGYGPRLGSNEAGLELLVEAITAAGYRAPEDMALGLDVAATHFYRQGRYHLSADGLTLNSDEMVAYLHKLCERWPVASLEDGLAEDDWDGWTHLTRTVSRRTQILGDDLFTTHVSRIHRGQTQGAANAVLIKMNQVGTLTETFEAIRYAQDQGYRTVISARSGETEDTTMADLAVGASGGQIKVGSLQRSSRLAKWNQLFRIEEELGPHAEWAGASAIGWQAP